MDHMEFEEEIQDREYFEKKVESIESILKENQILLNDLKNELRKLENDK
jgi:hypothetical protein